MFVRPNAALLVLGVLWRCALCDLPTHCLSGDAEGSWLFALGQSSTQRSSCGHSRPDDETREPLLGEKPNSAALTLNVELRPGGEAQVGADSGTWTTVSDEALEVKAGGREFLAFFGFKPLPVDIGGEHLPLSVQRGHSRCNETVLGWYVEGDRASFGCWYGWRTDVSKSFLQRRTRRIAHRRAGRKFALRGGQLEAGRSLDWRNVSGKSWVDPPVQQNRCGGCYAIASIHMLSARHRIANGDSSAESFSVAFPLHCGEYTQGCMGGFPELAAKWSEDVGLVPESCAPLPEDGVQEDGVCNVRCDTSQLGAERRFRASRHRYVFGGEEAIIDELRKGPLAASFKSDPALMEYTSGIWEPPPPDTQDGEGFVAPTHSVLLVGYGEEAGASYWLVQNAWGPEWGERGAFRISRDAARERGFEALVVAADVVRDDRPTILDEFVSGQGLPGTAFISRMTRRATQTAHRGQPLCRAPAENSDEEPITVRFDPEQNFRGLSFGDSAGTETAVWCAGPAPPSCRVANDGENLPECSSLDGCECDLSGQDLPYPGMKAMAEKVALMCTSSSSPIRALMIGLGGGAISSYLRDRCPQGRLHLENVEKDSRVAALASKFFGFHEDADSALEVQDGLTAVLERAAREPGMFDAVMVDCFAARDKVPDACRSIDFLRAVKRSLKDDGVLIQNIWARSSASPDVEVEFNMTLSNYGETFQASPRREVVFDAPQSLQYMLYGLNGKRWERLLPVEGDES